MSPSKSIALSLLICIFAYTLDAQAAVQCMQGKSLVQFIQDPVTSLDGGYELMNCLKQHFLSTSDRRAIFLAIYVQVTVGVKQAVTQGNVFHNNPWVGFYDYTFVNFYRTALLNWETGNHNEVPKAWAKAFDHAANNDKLLIIQHALLGVNAHINNDLAQVISMLSIKTDTDVKHVDSLAINPVIIKVYHDMLPGIVRLYAPVYNATDREGQLNSLVGTLEASYREKAWKYAFLLTDAGTGSTAHKLLCDKLNDESDLYADAILMMKMVPLEFVPRLRALEGNQIKSFCNTVSWACVF